MARECACIHCNSWKWGLVLSWHRWMTPQLKKCLKFILHNLKMLQCSHKHRFHWLHPDKRYCKRPCKLPWQKHWQKNPSFFAVILEEPQNISECFTWFPKAACWLMHAHDSPLMVMSQFNAHLQPPLSKHHQMAMSQWPSLAFRNGPLMLRGAGATLWAEWVAF